MKRRLFKLLLFALSCAAALLALEYAVRRLFPAFDPSGHLRLLPATPDRPALGPPDTTLRHVKNTGDFDVTVRFNRYGFRDRRDLKDSRPDDWVVVGDSFGFGWGVEEAERFSDQLEQRLGVRVFNIAMPAGSLSEYRRLLDHARALGLNTRKVIVGVCMENDLVIHEAQPEAPESLRALLKRKSAAYFLFTHIVHTHPALRDLFVRLGLVMPSVEGMPRNEYSEELVQSAASALEKTVEGYEPVILIIPSRALWVGGWESAEAKTHDAFVAALRAKGM
ncbi:MAG: SGNH/GDSL hydrolase family protein, partial [Verrucomicrobiota bacterium]